MSVRSIKARMHEAVAALPEDVIRRSKATNIADMKDLVEAFYIELCTYAHHCGAADADHLAKEAENACEQVDEAFRQPVRRQYSAVAVGASL